MQDKSSRADSDIAAGIRNGCFLGHPSLLGLGLGLSLPRKREEIKSPILGDNMVGIIWNGDPTLAWSDGVVLPNGVRKSEKFAGNVLYGDIWFDGGEGR